MPSCTRLQTIFGLLNLPAEHSALHGVE